MSHLPGLRAGQMGPSRVVTKDGVTLSPSGRYDADPINLGQGSEIRCDLARAETVVQQEAELNFYSKDDPSRQIGSGLSDLDAGVRLRYEISRKFAPYIGFAYAGKYRNTAR